MATPRALEQPARGGTLGGILLAWVLALAGCAAAAPGSDAPAAPPPAEPPPAVAGYEGTYGATAGATEANLIVAAGRFRLVTAPPRAATAAPDAVWAVVDGTVRAGAGTVVLAVTAVTENGAAVGLERYAGCGAELVPDASFPERVMRRLLECLDWIEEAPTEVRRISPRELVAGEWWAGSAATTLQTLTIGEQGTVTWRRRSERAGRSHERVLHFAAEFGDATVALQLSAGEAYADDARVHVMTAAEVRAYQNGIDRRGPIHYTIGAATMTWRWSPDGDRDVRFRRVTAGTPPPPPGEPVKPVLVGYASRPTDPFELLEAAVAGDLLVLEVAYGGGCEKHTFELLTSDSFQAGSPVVLGMLLFHDAGGDACEAWLRRRLWFDLRPVRDLYRRVYREQAGSVELRLPHVPDGSLVYRFRTDPRGQFAVLEK